MLDYCLSDTLEDLFLSAVYSYIHIYIFALHIYFKLCLLYDSYAAVKEELKYFRPFYPFSDGLRNVRIRLMDNRNEERNRRL